MSPLHIYSAVGRSAVTLGAFLYAVLVIGAAYLLGRLHEAKYINEKQAREVDLSALLDQATARGDCQNDLRSSSETAKRLPRASF
jgi:hypothetical protein